MTVLNLWVEPNISPLWTPIADTGKLPSIQLIETKSTFTKHRGLYRFKRLPFGLVSAPATFQRPIDVILSSARFRCALTFFDNIFVFSSTFEQHIHDLHLVLSLVRSAGVTLKLASVDLMRRKFRIWDILWSVKDYAWMSRRVLSYRPLYARKRKQVSEDS
jgi:Reverse transcriptase (RNA-dependent DNA polymerase)